MQNFESHVWIYNITNTILQLYERERLKGERMVGAIALRVSQRSPQQ